LCPSRQVPAPLSNKQFRRDDGSQFTGAEFTGVLIKNGIAISMDGKGAWRDNVFVERLWRSLPGGPAADGGGGQPRRVSTHKTSS
jgi:transposase InsO family protein